MNLSMKWLADYVDVKDVDIRDYCEKLTYTGSKVEGYAQTGSVTVYFGKEAVEVSDIPDGYWRFSTRRNRLF